MNRPHLLIVAASLAFIQPVFAAPAAPVTALEASNPFAKLSTLPFHYPAFDKIKDEHFVPAYAAGMREQLREIDGIANNPKPATFDNTIVAMERSALPPQHRVPFFLHIDEFQSFSSEAFASLFSEARKFAAHFCCVNQFTDQLSPAVRAAVS